MLLVHKESYSKLTKEPLPGFVTSSKGLLQEESDMPKACTSCGFDPNAYKLVMRSDFDFNKPQSLGHVIEEKPYGLNDMQIMVQRHGGEVVTPNIGVDYIPS